MTLICKLMDIKLIIRIHLTQSFLMTGAAIPPYLLKSSTNHFAQ